jgi:ketosteroid isomerase-like protein
MSQENMELARRAYEGWGKGDPEPVIEAFAQEVEWDYSAYPLPDVAERGTGRENYLQFLADFSASWAKHEITVSDIIAFDEHVVIAIHERMETSRGNLALERDIAHACTLRDGRVVLVRAFRTKAEALQAARLKE